MTKKKLLFILLVMALFSLPLVSAYAIPDSVFLKYVDPKDGNTGQQKSPKHDLEVIIDGYILTLPAFEDDYTLELRDENDVIVYTDYVPSGTTQIVLPSTLSGDFELRFVADTYYYIGNIIL